MTKSLIVVLVFFLHTSLASEPSEEVAFWEFKNDQWCLFVEGSLICLPASFSLTGFSKDVSNFSGINENDVRIRVKAIWTSGGQSKALDDILTLDSVVHFEEDLGGVVYREVQVSEPDPIDIELSFAVLTFEKIGLELLIHSTDRIAVSTLGASLKAYFSDDEPAKE